MTSTEPTSAPRPPDDTAASTAPSGVDLARVALQAAKATARKRGEQPGAGKPRRVRTGRAVRGDGREPVGLAAAFQQLVTERAWEVPAACGTVLQQWPAIAPDLAPHVKAVGFDADQGRLNLLPDSPAYATQLRMSTARLIAMANKATDREAVRSIRVLPPGTHTSAPAADVPPKQAGPVRTREEASGGYRQALAAHHAAKPKQGDWLTPAVRAAIERQDQVLRERREAAKTFADGMAALKELRTKAARSTSPDGARTRACGASPQSALAASPLPLWPGGRRKPGRAGPGEQGEDLQRFAAEGPGRTLAAPAASHRLT